jgi:hypothetical protein
VRGGGRSAPVPHQLGHLACRMLWHLVSLLRIMELLGHTRPYLTFTCVEVTQRILADAVAGGGAAFAALSADSFFHRAGTRQSGYVLARAVKLIAVAESVAADQVEIGWIRNASG